MRKISAWAAIALVRTAIAGTYGMDFDHMPELHWRYGYGMALAVIAAACTARGAGVPGVRAAGTPTTGARRAR